MSSPWPQEPDEHQWFIAEIQAHEPALRCWLQRRFPSLSDVDDLIQNTYVRILRTRRCEPARIYAAKTFLFQIARNIAIDELRHREVRGFESSQNFEDAGLAADGQGISEDVSRREEVELLHDAIRSLPERCRQVVTLRKIYRLPQKEIARQLGISENTVEVQVRLGVRRCAEYLARYGLP